MNDTSKWSAQGDEMVPVIGERVEAVMRRKGIGVSELARQIDELQQTLSLIIAGTTKKCRRRRLDKIASELRVPTEWLTGELDWLPWGVSRDGWRQYADGSVEYLEFPEDRDSPLASQLAESEFLEACHRALVRDYATTNEGEFDIYREGWPKEIIGALRSLVSPDIWGGTLLKDEDANEDDEDQIEIAAVALAEGFKISLAPWLEGKARLNVGNLVAVRTIQGGALKEYLNVMSKTLAAQRKRFLRGKKAK